MLPSKSKTSSINVIIVGVSNVGVVIDIISRITTVASTEKSYKIIKISRGDQKKQERG